LASQSMVCCGVVTAPVLAWWCWIVPCFDTVHRMDFNQKSALIRHGTFGCTFGCTPCCFALQAFEGADVSTEEDVLSSSTTSSVSGTANSSSTLSSTQSGWMGPNGPPTPSQLSIAYKNATSNVLRRVVLETVSTYATTDVDIVADPDQLMHGTQHTCCETVPVGTPIDPGTGGTVVVTCWLQHVAPVTSNAQGKRIDGRGLTDIRPIRSRANLLPRTHGSALFTRGETQVGILVCTT
jgi:hypothetical protein